MDSPSINPDGQELYDQLTNACGADWQQAARRVHKETSIVEPRDKKTRSCVLRGVICRNKWYLKNHQWFLKGETGTELSSGEHSHDAMYTTQHGDGEIPCWMEEITWVYIEILCMYTCTYSILWYKLQSWGSWRSFCFFYKGDLFKNGKEDIRLQ